MPRWWRRTKVGARRANLYFWLEIAAAVALLGMLTSSYLILTGAEDTRRMLPSVPAAAMLVGTLIPAMMMLVLFGRRLAIRRAGGTTARLHVNMVFFFSLVAAIPTLLVAVFASFLFQSGVEFSSQTRGILENANELARGYYEQNQVSLASNTTAMAGDIRDFLQRYSLYNPDFPAEYYGQVAQRELNHSAILQEGPGGSLGIAAIADPEEGDLIKRATAQALPALKTGKGVIVSVRKDRVDAVAAIDLRAGIYLYNARDSDMLALSQWERARSVLQDYDVLQQRWRARQVQFNVALFAVALALVGLAVWLALRFADRQVKPLA
ncbi:MAG: PAS domain-containing sensor histidine kinase, partial [Croceibacterium sp.]